MDTSLLTRDPVTEAITGLEALRRCPPAELPALAQRLREYLLASVSRSGGHLAAGLGSIELTVALHRVFATPGDRLVWDTGHQAYPHKILTGRGPQLGTVRCRGGLSGFPLRAESEYDAFGVAHAGTAISAALGMALAAAGTGSERRIVAIVGDGGLTAGMAYEALNHAGGLQADLLVILNDNEMSIAPSVGGLQEYLHRLKTGAGLTAPGRGPGPELPPYRTGARDTLHGTLPTADLFRFLGFRYTGPVDGHDVTALVEALTRQRGQQGPRLLHVVTQKGKGYPPAEADPGQYHGVVPFDPEQGLVKPTAGAPTYTEVFAEWACELAAGDPRAAVITPAMRDGSGLAGFARRFPERFFDAAIAEQHAVTLAAGMACEGWHPVVAIYSTFLQRAYDQLIHDVALQNLPVLFAIDRAGLVGPDGPSHAGSFDLTFLRCVPNLLVMAPADEDECRQMLFTGYCHDGPAAVRYPRSKGPGRYRRPRLRRLPLGRAQVRREGRRVALLGFGTMVGACAEAGQRLDATVVNMRYVKPLDTALLEQLARSHELLVTVEDNALAGGAGSAVNEALLGLARERPAVLNLGLPDRFVGHGTRDELLGECGLDVAGILAAVARRRALLDQ